jgi:hypothetical protein
VYEFTTNVPGLQVPPNTPKQRIWGGFATQQTSAKKGEFAQIGNKLSRRALTTTQNGEWGTENSQ